MTEAFWVVVTVQMKKRQERHGQECQIRRLAFELRPVVPANRLGTGSTTEGPGGSMQGEKPSGSESTKKFYFGLFYI